MKRSSILWFIVVVVVLALAACAPKAIPSSPANAPQKQEAPKSAAPTTSDAEWAKVQEAAKKEGKVMAFTWGLTGTPGDTVVKFFKDKYGIEIERVTGLTPTLIERIKTDLAGGRYVADYFDASASSNYALVVAGATEPIGALLPAIKEKGVFYRSPQWDAEGHMITTTLSGFAIGINTKLVPSGQEPKSWREVMDPKWAGKVATSSPTTSPDPIYLYVLKEKLGLDDAYFPLLGKQAKIVPANRDAGGMLSRGEVSIWIPASSTMAAPMVVEGAPIKFVMPKEGPIQSGGTTMVRIKNGPNPNATRFFMNWMLTAEGQKVVNEARASSPLRNDVPDPTPEAIKIRWENAAILQWEQVLQITKIQSEKTLSRIMGVD